MKTIEIRLPELGNAVGTTGWVAPKLEVIANGLMVSQTRSDDPCLTYKHWSDFGADGKPKTHVLCIISNEELRGYDNRYGLVHCVNAECEEGGEGPYLFQVLSATAKEKVDEFLDAVCQKFWEEYNAS